MKLFILNSSIGRKLIMSISGLFLITFLMVHLAINSLLLLGSEAFQAGCEIMELPVIQIIVPVLAGGFVVHIAYAFLLSYQNYVARGSENYASGKKSKTTSWASKNMLVLGIIVFGFLAVHLTHFWAKMQLAHFTGSEAVPASDAYNLVAMEFRNPVIGIIYLIWYAALWFHLMHGFWSALQSIGINNSKWYVRIKVVGQVFATLIAAGFTVITLFFLFGLDKIFHV